MSGPFSVNQPQLVCQTYKNRTRSMCQIRKFFIFSYQHLLKHTKIAINPYYYYYYYLHLRKVRKKNLIFVSIISVAFWQRSSYEKILLGVTQCSRFVWKKYGNIFCSLLLFRPGSGPWEPGGQVSPPASPSRFWQILFGNP